MFSWSALQSLGSIQPRWPGNELTSAPWEWSGYSTEEQFVGRWKRLLCKIFFPSDFGTSYRIASKVEGRGVKSLDFAGAREVVPAPLHANHQAAAVSIEETQNFPTRWVPQFNRDVDPNELIFRRVRGILNKLTPDKFNKLCYELLNVGIDTKYILKGVILLVFEKALDEPKYSSMYSQLCLRLSQEAPNFDDPGKTGNSTFRRLLLKQCEEEFNNRSKATQAFDKKDGPLTPEEEELRATTKRKMLGNIRFIGELAKLDMLHEAILHKCIKQLLDKKKRATAADFTEDMECLCHLMRTVGPRIDVLKAKLLVDQYFSRIQHLMTREDVTVRIRFMMQDILELRAHKWVPRKAACEAGPKTIHQIRQESWQEHSFPRRGGHSAASQMAQNSPPRHPGGWYGGLARPVAGRGQDPTYSRGLSDVFVTDNGLGPSYDDTKDFDEFSSHDPWERLSANFNASSALPQSRSPQINSGQRRGVSLRPAQMNSSQEISLRPAKDSIAAQTPSLLNRGPQVTTKQPLDPPHRNNIPAILEKTKPSKKSTGPSGADLDKHMESIIAEAFTTKDEEAFTASVKDIISSKCALKFLKMLMETALEKAEEDHIFSCHLVVILHQEGLLSGDHFIKGVNEMLERKSEEAVEVKAYVALCAAVAVSEDVAILSEVSKLFKGGKHFPAFLLCLKELHALKGEEWLTKTINYAKVNLLTTLSESDRTNERVMAILEEKSLVFLFPLLQIEVDLYKKIEEDPTVASVYKWIKDNVDASLHTSNEFISVLTTCILKYVTGESTLAEGVDLTQIPDKDLVEKERASLSKLQSLIEKFVHERTDLQVRVLYALQVFCHRNNYPKGLLLRMFMLLYDMEVVEEEAFVKWKEDVSDNQPGKGKALFQVNSWLTWLETADEEGSESELE